MEKESDGELVVARRCSERKKMEMRKRDYDSQLLDTEYEETENELEDADRYEVGINYDN